MTKQQIIKLLENRYKANYEEMKKMIRIKDETREKIFCATCVEIAAILSEINFSSKN